MLNAGECPVRRPKVLGLAREVYLVAESEAHKSVKLSVLYGIIFFILKDAKYTPSANK